MVSTDRLKAANLSFEAVNSQVAADHSTSLFFFVLFAIFILHSRESELYRYTLDGKSELAWELPFPGHLSSI